MKRWRIVVEYMQPVEDIYYKSAMTLEEAEAAVIKELEADDADCIEIVAAEEDDD